MITTVLQPSPTTVGSAPEGTSASAPPDSSIAAMSAAACSVTVAPGGGVNSNSDGSGVE